MTYTVHVYQLTHSFPFPDFLDIHIAINTTSITTSTDTTTMGTTVLTITTVLLSVSRKQYNKTCTV